MTLMEMFKLVSACTYKPGWSVSLHGDPCALGDTRPYIQLTVADGVDSVTGKPCEWKSGTRYLSFHMCRQEVVGAVFGLIKDAEAHEMHEWFRFKGASIYNPHLDPEVLVEVAKRRDSFNVRENAMSMVEAA